MTKEKDRWYQELVDSEHELMDLTSAHERLQEKLTKKESKSSIFMRCNDLYSHRGGRR